MKNIRGCVLSDLHYLSSRSCYDALRSEIHARLSTAAVIVLNGDIFDFRWSSLPRLEDSLQRAIQELESLCRTHPTTRIHYVLGNHDCHPLFVEALNRLIQRFPQISQHAHEVQIGSSLFLHGDILQAGSRTRLEAYRTRFHRDHHLLKGFDPLYQTLHNLGFAELYSHISSTRTHTWARQLHRLIHIGELRVKGEVRDVYYGHTHSPSTNIMYRGRRYHNTGAVLIRTPWKILPFQVQCDE